VESETKILVYDFLERPTAASSFGLELGGDVIVESEGGPHALMLIVSHHDVNRL
jgi:hypothetical protein